MNPRKILWFFPILLNCWMMGCGSSLKCCFEILSNRSISYHLSEPPGDFCTPTWSEREFVVVDEYGNVDETKVVYFQPQKLILKGNMDEKVKRVKYRMDCPRTGQAYSAECHDPCNATDVPRTTPVTYTTQGTGRDSGESFNISIIISIVVIVIVIIIIIIIVICAKRNKYRASKDNYGKAVPQNDNSTV